MDIHILASGSKGNATYIKTPKTKLLIDAGISHRQIKLRLEAQNLTLDGLDGLLLTHEHSDHTKGLKQTIKQTNVPLYTGLKTYRKVKDTIPETTTHIPIEPDQPFMFNDLIITPLKTSHDAVESFGFIIQEEDKRLVYITDTGYLEQADFYKIKNAETYIMESNYDVTMLFDSERPYYLKKRIDSVKGHLSNDDAAYYLTKLIGKNTKHIVLAHPSLECNTEACALNTLHTVFEAYDTPLNNIAVHVAKQFVPLKKITLS